MRDDLFAHDGQHGGRRNLHSFQNRSDAHRFIERQRSSLTFVGYADLHGLGYGIRLKRLMAPRERFELPRHEDSGFRIHRDTGLCDLGCGPSTLAFDISLTSVMHRSRTQSPHLTNQSLQSPCLPSSIEVWPQSHGYCQWANPGPSRNPN